MASDAQAEVNNRWIRRPLSGKPARGFSWLVLPPDENYRTGNSLVFLVMFVDSLSKSRRTNQRIQDNGRDRKQKTEHRRQNLLCHAICLHEFEEAAGNFNLETAGE